MSRLNTHLQLRPPLRIAYRETLSATLPLGRAPIATPQFCGHARIPLGRSTPFPVFQMYCALSGLADGAKVLLS